MNLKDKVVVVTGSSRGIGRAIAGHLAGLGAKVVITSRNAVNVKKACSILEKENCRVSGIPADISKESDIKKLFDFTLKKYGTIDVWINNAGLSSGYRYIQDVPEKEIRKIVDTNITGTMLACRQVIPWFIKNKKGVIINMTGRGGRLESSANMAVYAATKAAVTSLTKSLAEENRKFPMSIHALLPGMVETDFYKDTPVSPGLKSQMQIIPILLKAYGTPIGEVANKAAKIAGQKPGKKTGKLYKLGNPLRMFTAMPQMIASMARARKIQK
jgi:NAD(P)-dependent dehydrogenase (short-subunit alcohol dehydrogenase family)